MSPHLTIYAMQLTNMLSITFRICGAAMSFLLYGIGLAAAFDFLSVPALFSFLQALPAPILFLGKLALVFPFTYHWMNGIRHLAWDLGFGLSLRGVYTGGYAMLTAAATTAVALLSNAKF
jgi:succinate dehydrogenase (ubiquinone) cytochrome b560 subunit